MEADACSDTAGLAAPEALVGREKDSAASGSLSSIVPDRDGEERMVGAESMADAPVSAFAKRVVVTQSPKVVHFLACPKD